MTRGGALLLIAAGLFVSSCASASVRVSTSANVSIHRAVPSSMEGAISVEADGWTFSIPLEGVMWIDATGTHHGSGRPDCLPPGGTNKPVTFASVDVTVQGESWRPVVWVSCQ